MPIALLLLLNYKVLKIYSYDNSLKSGHQNVKSIVCKVQLQTIGFFHILDTSTHYATYGLYQNGRKEDRRKSSSIYYGTRPHRCNNGRI